MRSFCTFLFILISNHFLLGQNSNHQYKLELGLSLAQLREKMVSPQRYTGPVANIGFSYSNNKEKFEQRFYLNFGIGGLRNTYNWKDILAIVNLNYNVDFSLESSNQYFIGANFNSTSILNYFADISSQHIYWLSNTGIGPSFRYNLEKKLGLPLNFSVAIPLLNITSRPPTNRILPDQPSVSGIFSSLIKGYSTKDILLPKGVLLDVSYKPNIEKSNKEFSYTFNWFQYRSPEKIQFLQHKISYQFIF